MQDISESKAIFKSERSCTFSHLSLLEPKMSWKILPGVQKSDLIYIFTVPKILGHTEIYTGVFVKILSCGLLLENGRNFGHNKNVFFQVDTKVS